MLDHNGVVIAVKQSILHLADHSGFDSKLAGRCFGHLLFPGCGLQAADRRQLACFTSYNYRRWNSSLQPISIICDE